MSKLSERKWIYDKVSLKTYINANRLIDPTKVILVCDLLREIINVGIVINNYLVIELTLDAVYGSEGDINY